MLTVTTGSEGEDGRALGRAYPNRGARGSHLLRRAIRPPGHPRTRSHLGASPGSRPALAVPASHFTISSLGVREAAPSHVRYHAPNAMHAQGLMHVHVAIDGRNCRA